MSNSKTSKAVYLGGGKSVKFSENDEIFNCTLNIDKIKENDCIAFTATIARYKHYKDTISTYLNRCILIENKGSA